MLQFFYRYINGNESDNVPGCPACLQGSMESWTQNDENSDDPGQFFDVSKPLIGFEEVCCCLLMHAYVTHTLLFAVAGFEFHLMRIQVDWTSEEALTPLRTEFARQFAQMNVGGCAGGLLNGYC